MKRKPPRAGPFRDPDERTRTSTQLPGHGPEPDAGHVHASGSVRGVQLAGRGDGSDGFGGTDVVKVLSRERTEGVRKCGAWPRRRRESPRRSPGVAGSYELVERRADGSLLLRPEHEKLSDVLRETDRKSVV